MSEGEDPPPVTSEVNDVNVTVLKTDENSNETEAKPKYIALFDFEPREANDLGFKKGDILTIYDDSDDWWYAKNDANSEEGYVPCNYIQPINSLRAEEWFFPETTKGDANNLLLAPALTKGAFMLRDSDSKKGYFSLSIRDKDIEGIKIKHYRIERSKKDSTFYLTKRRKFKSVQELVEFYKENERDLPCKLGKPCPREKPGTRTLGRTVWEIERDSLKWLHKLGEGSFGEVWKVVGFAQGAVSHSSLISLVYKEVKNSKNDSEMDMKLNTKRAEHSHLEEYLCS